MRSVLLVFMCCVMVSAAEPQLFDLSTLKLVQRIDCAAVDSGEDFAQQPTAASQVVDILGQPARILPNDKDESQFVAYRVGRGLGLKAGQAYLLTVTYPEDQPRTFYILNRGNETGRGIATGSAVADNIFGRYVNNNPESIDYPLSGGWQTWQTVFSLHERFTELAQPRGDALRGEQLDHGFWVIIAQTKQVDAIGSAGAAIGSIALYELPEQQPPAMTINYPPEGLPRRAIFSREEMADGVVTVPHGADKPENRGVDNPIDWYEFKARNMRFLGMNTFAIDLLEFGHNQGWDAKDNNWYVPSAYPQRWSDMLAMLDRYPELQILPYYEYGGSTAQGSHGKQRKVATLGGEEHYTHITWVEKNSHVDITDPDTLAEAKRVIDLTVLHVPQKARFLGTWFRPRPSQWPISFAEGTLGRYAADTGIAVSRELLQQDRSALAAYYAWWMAKRRAFLGALADHMRAGGVDDAVCLLTVDASEPGTSLPGNAFVTDQPELWQQRMQQLPDGVTPRKVVAFEDVVGQAAHAKQLTALPATWGKWEWQHAVPWADPASYADDDRATVGYAYHRLYSVSSPALFAEWQRASGAFLERHHSLNENTMDKKLGYFACDVEQAGPYSMLADARAVAYGDPRYLGYLISNTLCRGYPQYARAFNQAFLALPALPSTVVPGAASDDAVVVRRIDGGEHGTWLAVVNTGLLPLRDVSITLPLRGALRDAGTDTIIAADTDRYRGDLYPGQLLALHIK